jgi:hypothetical protein
MHVGVLAAIRIEGLPIASEFLRNSPYCSSQEPVPDDCRDISDKSIRVWVACDLGAGRG